MAGGVVPSIDTIYRDFGVRYQAIVDSEALMAKHGLAAGPASYGMTDTMGRMHSDAQFAGSSSVPAQVEMMGFLGMGNSRQAPETRSRALRKRDWGRPNAVRQGSQTLKKPLRIAYGQKSSRGSSDGDFEALPGENDAEDWRGRMDRNALHMRRRIVGFLSGTGAFVLAPPVIASDEMKPGRPVPTSSDEGRRLMRAGRLDEAVVQLEAAWKSTEVPEVLFDWHFATSVSTGIPKRLRRIERIRTSRLLSGATRQSSTFGLSSRSSRKWQGRADRAESLYR